MAINFFRSKKSCQLLFLSTVISYSAFLSNGVNAETQSLQVNSSSKSDSSLIHAIGNDPMVVSPSQAVSQTMTGESAIIHQINQELVSSPTTKKAQGVSSVSQLSDVRPTDWAFTALQSLVERYGCIAGYPDSTFRGKQATSRYEFAAGLNACLDKINEIISAGLADKVSKEDLATLQKLQEEFAAELATLRGRVDALDAKTAKLEAQQFSTTTKLFGQAIFGLQGRANNTASIFGAGVKNVPDNGTNINFGASVQLSLLTQFDNRSVLLTGLQVGNISTGATGISSLNNSFTRLAYETNTNNSVILSDLTYRFLAGDRFAVIVGPAGVNPITVFRGANRYESAGQGAISAFAQRNPILGIGNTTGGLGFDWQISDRISFQAVYSANAPANTSGNGGLFGGGFTTGAQLVVTPVNALDIALYYLRSYSSNSPFGSLGTGIGDDIIAFPPTSPAQVNTDAFGSTINWQISPKLNLGGWIGFTSSTVAALTGSVQTFNWMSYLTFPDLFGEGNLAGLYVGQLPKITSSDLSDSSNIPNLFNSNPITLGSLGGQNVSTTQVELFYRQRLSNNISVTPGLIFLFNPGNRAGSDTITIGVLRTTFTF